MGDTDRYLLYENDWLFPGGSPPLGDGGDRYRTTGVRFNWNKFSAGLNFFTGDPGLKKSDRQSANGVDYIELGEKFRASIFYLGFGQHRIGVNTEYIRDAIQNRLIHDRLLQGRHKHFSVERFGIGGHGLPYYNYGNSSIYSTW